MTGRTAIEEEFGIDLDSSEPDVRKGIAAGIRAEEKQARFYSGMEGVLRNHEIAHFFSFLSREKELQKDILEKAMDSLDKGGGWPDLEYDQGDVEEAFRKAGELAGKLRMDAGDVDVLEKAIDATREATAFYERFADALRGPGNDFFRNLAGREQRHHDLLVEILDLVRQGEREG